MPVVTAVTISLIPHFVACRAANRDVEIKNRFLESLSVSKLAAIRVSIVHLRAAGAAAVVAAAAAPS
jgi:hypothetical protein